jgi:hypothetical protein
VRRDFGSKRYDFSNGGASYEQKPYYGPRSIEDGRVPVPDSSGLLARFRKRLDERRGGYSVATVEQLSTPEQFTSLELGAHDPENHLPISDYKEVITQSIANNRVTIIVAETGAGKSTQVPQYLLEAGYVVNMTQPRRLAANMLGDRIGRRSGALLVTEV